MQEMVIVLLAVLASATQVGYGLYRNASGKAGCVGCGGCGRVSCGQPADPADVACDAEST